MSEINSNKANAIVYLGDFIKNGYNVLSEDCYTVVSYNYTCKRSRNSAGVPYGPTHSALFEVQIRNFSDKCEASILNHMKGNMATDFSVALSPIFDKSDRIRDFYDCFVVRGYVVDVNEIYSDQDNTTSETGQRIMQIRILLCDITYVGNTSNVKLSITNA